MKKGKLAKFKETKKQKLTPVERSQVAKDRWAKIRANKAAENMVVTINTMLEQGAAKYTPVPSLVETIVGVEITSGQEPIIRTEMLPAPPPVEQEAPAPSELEVSVLQVKVETDGGRTLAAAPQLAPVASKKAKRIPVPKEFLTALKTADSLLAKAIEEYEDCQRRITYLSGSIPRLQRTVLALRNESNPDAPVSLPNAFNYPAPTAFKAPQPFQPHNPLAAIQAAMDAAQVALPVSRAVGGVQLSPDVIGSLEGPDDDDDEDRFITGAGEKGWIGG